MCLIEAGVSGVLQRERRTSHTSGGGNQIQVKPYQELSLTSRISDERRIKYCQFLHSNAVDVGSESLSATLLETILAFVEVHGHNVVMLHSDQEPVLVQLLKAVRRRRVKRTLVRDGPRASRQSQGKIENANRVINGVCRAMWLSLDLLREKQPSDSILLAWLIRHAAWCLTRFQVKTDGRIAFVRVFGKAYTSQVPPFGERVMYKYTSVPTSNLDQRWDHGIWVGKAPMTDEHIILTENGVQNARSLHRVPPEERFVVSEFKKV